VPAGKPLTPSILESPTLIRRGQIVNLEARSGGLTVKMTGIAKSEGILGQIIDVENKATSRRVQAIVRSRKSAEVLLN
jgi:flagella basal body P-ring formation protein FlgA